VEAAQVETRTQRRFRALAQLDDLQFADLVGERLARPGNIAIDFGANLVHRQCGVRRPEIAGPPRASSHRVHAGIDDQAASPPHLVDQAPKALIRGMVDAHFLAELFAVERPAFAERVREEARAKLRQVAKLARQCALQVMPGHGLVQRQRGQDVERPRVERVRVHPILAGGADRSRVVAPCGVVRRQRFRHGLDRIRHARQRAEVLRQLAIDFLRDPRGFAQQLRCRFRVELRIGAQEGDEVGKGAVMIHVAKDRLHLATKARNLRHSDLVDLSGVASEAS
jgi:hypothetical protein